MLCCEKVKIAVGNKTLLSNISFTMLPGSITYIKGANGIGKSNLLKSLAGIKKVSSGEITLFQEKLDDLEQPFCLYIGHNLGLNLETTTIEQILFWSKLYNSLHMLSASINYWGLNEVLDQKISTLSKGNQRKVALSKLTSCYSQLWLLDEIDIHLDDNNKALLSNIITTKASNGGIIFIASHSSDIIKGSQIIDLENYNASINHNL